MLYRNLTYWAYLANRHILQKKQFTIGYEQMKGLFNLVITLAIITPVTIFFGYIIMDEGDQFTAEHYMVTGLSTVPLIFALLVKFLMSGAEKE